MPTSEFMPSATRPLRILLIDDSPEDREFICHLLRGLAQRYNCEEVASGSAGLRVCLEHPAGPPDCVLMDYHLPDYEAPEILAALGGADLPCCPVVVVTGSTGGIDGRRLLRLGAQDFIGKNWMNAESLARCIDNAIERFGMERELRERRERLRLALEVSQTFAFDWNPATDQLVCSGNCLAVFHLPSAAATLAFATGSHFTQRVHPDDRATYLATISGLNASADHYHTEYRWVWDDGSEYILAESARGFFDAHGRLQRLVGASTNVTAQRRAAYSLQQTEQRFRQMAEMIGEVFWLSVPLTAQLLYVSPAFETIWGRTCHELYANPRLWLEAVVAADQPPVQQHLAALAQGGHHEIEYRIQRPDGQIRWIHERAYAHHDGRVVTLMSGVSADVTQSRLAAAALQQSEAMFQALFEASSDAIILMDDYRVMDCNQAAVQLLGCTARSDLFGRHPADFSLPQQPSGEASQTLALAHHRTVLHTGAHRFEWHIRRPDGSDIVADVALTRVDLQDRAIVQGIARDITERQALLSTLAEAKEAAERANTSKSLFLANMSHEIRTPMTAIMGMAELCLATYPNERQRHYLTRIQTAAESLRRIIDDILDFSKIEAGRLDMVAAPFTLAQVCDNLISLLEERARAKGLALVMVMDTALGAQSWLGDAQRLGQVLTNLVGNAIKFSQHGDIRVTITALPPTFPTDGRITLQFQVQDQGIGIAPEDQVQLFQPFTQADAAHTRIYGGTGLGLAISRRLVELMDGRINVTSQLGTGSTFTFTVRVPPSTTAPLTSAERQRLDKDALAPLRGADILLVEDTLLNQEVICELLESAGLQVRVAVNGQEALTAMTHAVPDAVLMDCHMPVLDGFETTRRLRAAGYDTLPIIALTANALAGERDKCLAAGMNDYLSKPVDFGALYAALAHWVRPQPAVPAAAPVLTTWPQAQLPAALPGLDLERGLRHSNGKLALYMRLLHRFRDSRADDFVEQFQAARRQGDWITATRLAHTLKGSALTLGAMELGRVTAELEQAMIGAVTATLDQHLARVVRELERVLVGLALPAATLSHNAHHTIQTLLQLLEEHDITALDCADKLMRLMAGTPHVTQCHDIVQAVAEYDFTAARTAVQRLLMAVEQQSA